MEKICAYDIETTESHFAVEIFRDEKRSNFSATYSGTKPKVAKIMKPGDIVPLIREVGSGTVEGNDESEVLEACRRKIKSIDGEITKETRRS